MTKIMAGYYKGSINGNVYVVIRNGKVWDWATYKGIGGEAFNSGTALSSSKAEAEAIAFLK